MGKKNNSITHWRKHWLAKLSLFVATFLVVSINALKSSDAQAQSWQAGACFYVGANYEGPRICVDGSRPEIPNFNDYAGFNDRSTSIALYGGARVYICEHSNFRSPCGWVDNSIPDLGALGWAGKISSARLDGGNWNPSPPPGSFGRACFYEHAGFSGRSFCVDQGRRVNNLDGTGFNDVVSSIQLNGNMTVRICRDSHFRNCVDINRTIRNLDNHGWNDMISSIEVF